jgi:hypothetical protein
MTVLFINTRIYYYSANSTCVDNLVDKNACNLNDTLCVKLLGTTVQRLTELMQNQGQHCGNLIIIIPPNTILLPYNEKSK